jgi:hypothetical protein
MNKQVAVLQLLNSVNDFWFPVISDLLDDISYELGTKDTNLFWYIVLKKTDVFIKMFLVEQALFVGFWAISNNTISSRNKYVSSHATYFILDPHFIAMQF